MSTSQSITINHHSLTIHVGGGSPAVRVRIAPRLSVVPQLPAARECKHRITPGDQCRPCTIARLTEAVAAAEARGATRRQARRDVAAREGLGPLQLVRLVDLWPEA